MLLHEAVNLAFTLPGVRAKSKFKGFQTHFTRASIFNPTRFTTCNEWQLNNMLTIVSIHVEHFYGETSSEIPVGQIYLKLHSFLG